MSSSSSSSTARSATRRLLKELEAWHAECAREGGSVAAAAAGVERLGPVSEGDLFNWEAVINGRGIAGGYESGRWLLSISLPRTYPLHPPAIRFVTPVVHANISLADGEVCLDLLKEAWTPAYSVLETVRAVRLLLATPEPESPLNVDVAALVRAGDRLGAARLVEFWIRDGGGRYEGK